MIVFADLLYGKKVDITEGLILFCAKKQSNWESD